MNRRDAAWALARRWSDGVEGAAKKLCVPASTLGKELRGEKGYKLSGQVEEDLTLAALADGIEDPYAILNAFATNVGALVIPLPRALDEEGATFRCLADAATEFGQFMQRAGEAMADGKVTANELRDVEREFGELIAKGQSYIRGMRELHEAQKPEHLRAVKSA